MNASRDDAAGKIRVQSNRGGGCQWRREVGPLGRRKAATLTFVEAWNHDNVPEMRERTQQPWAKGTDVVAKKCSQCGTTPRFFAATIDGAPVLLEPRPSSREPHIFANPMVTAAAIDRVVHHSVILEFDVPSYRTGVAQQRGQKRG